MKKKLFKNEYILTASDMSISNKIYPYYSEEELRRMTNDDIMNRLTLLKKENNKFGVDVNSSNDEMQELKRELEKRANKKNKSDEPIYTSYDGEKFTINEMKEMNINFYNSITSYRYLINDIDDDKKDIKHILKTILESNSVYFVVGTDIGDMDSTRVVDKVELVRVLKKNEFSYGIAFIDYFDYLLTIELSFKTPVHEFSNSETIDIFLSYDDLSQIVKGINMDKTMTENWEQIQHWWLQKELFKNLD